MFKPFFVLFFFIFSSFSYAVDYSWYSNTYPDITGSTPDSVCSATAARQGRVHYDAAPSPYSYRFDCRYKSTSSGDLIVYANAFRTGDSCSGEYDPATGECKANSDPCESTKDQLISHRHKLGDLPADGSGKIINPQSPPNSICQNSCKFGNPASDGDCYRFASGDPAGAFCNYKYTGTGVTCTADEGDSPADQPDNNTPKSLDDVRCTDRVVKPDGTATYICHEVKEFVDPGKVDCGEVNGQWTCIAKQPAPVNEKSETTTEVVETPKADGSKEVVTTTTTNVTNCTSVGACTTTGSTTTKTTVINADGSSGGTTSSCTGSGCPDSSGKTQADREKEAAEEEAQEGKVEGGASCETPPVCSGDAIQCAVLQQQHKTRCDAEKARDFESVKGEIDTMLSGSEFQPSEELTVNVPSIIGQGARFLPAGCPAPMTTTVIGRAVALSFEPVCTAAESLAPLILIMSALGALLVVTRSS